MKKTLAFILALCLCVGLCACGGNSEPSTEPTLESTTIPEETTTPTEPEVVIPEVQMIINDSSEDTTNELRIFPANRSYDQWTAYAHYFVKSEKDTETIRIKLESQWGDDERVEEDFAVRSDELIDVDTNQWLTFGFSISASNLYFYRVTIYYGDTEELLATKTIYTPYEKAFYGESDFRDTPPTYHPMNGLLEKEQVFFDNCQYAVVDCAKKRHYSAVNSIFCWQTDTHLYMDVEYKATNGYESVRIVIPLNDLENYIATSSWDVIPDYLSVEHVVLDDYYYVERALTTVISG